jgi:hypothetical protein
MDLNLESIEALLKMVSAHKIDKLKVGDLEIVKTRHEQPKAETPAQLTRDMPEDLLYYSTSIPNRAAIEAQQLAFSQPKKK